MTEAKVIILGGRIQIIKINNLEDVSLVMTTVKYNHYYVGLTSLHNKGGRKE